MEHVTARVEQMNMVGQMAASVAHEIRNPLTAVHGYLQMIKIKGASWINQERLDLMISELDRTNFVITEYLLLAKDKVPDLKNCCLNSIIKAVFPLLQVTANTNTSIKLCLGEIPQILLDENEIRQLLFNLVNNGLQAMTKGGELVISTYTEEDTVVLSVRDQGSGIASQILEKIGTPFLTTKTNGTGLGLTTCYRIAQRHNATIDVETSNSGTTFLIRFA
jgi:signal transduction histidine kinase